MADSKITALTEDTVVTSDDLFSIVDSPAGTPVNKKLPVGTLFAGIPTDGITIKTSKTPASATDTGVAGTIAWDTSYIYVCTATNVWKRTAISTW